MKVVLFSLLVAGLLVASADLNRRSKTLSAAESSRLFGAGDYCNWGGASATSCCGNLNAAGAPGYGASAPQQATCSPGNSPCPRYYISLVGCGGE